MKKILWCGGSHLGNAKPVIDRAHIDPLASYSADFYKTASPMNRDWSHQGGRYTVHGSTVSGNAKEPDRSIDLAGFSLIVFVGHWLQPQKVFGVNYDQPLSGPLLRLVCQQSILTPSRFEGTFRWYNEPLALFPKLAECPVVLVPDPAPTGTHYSRIKRQYKEVYYEQLSLFCAEQSIHLCAQPEDTLRDDRCTKPEFTHVLAGRGPNGMHKTEAYWSFVFESALLPRIRRFLM